MERLILFSQRSEMRNLLSRRGWRRPRSGSWLGAPQCSGLGGSGAGRLHQGTHTHTLGCLGYQCGPHSRLRQHTAGSWAHWFAGRVKHGV